MATIVVKQMIVPIIKKEIEAKVKEFIKNNITNIFSSVITEFLIYGGKTLENNKYLETLNKINAIEGCNDIINGTKIKYADIHNISENNEKEKELEKKKNHLVYIIITKLIFTDYSKPKMGFDNEKEIVNTFFNYLLENDENLTDILDFTKASKTSKMILEKLGSNKDNTGCSSIDFKCYINSIKTKITQLFTEKLKIDIDLNNPVLLCIIKNRPEFILLNEFKNQLQQIMTTTNCDEIKKNTNKIIKNIQNNINNVIVAQKHPNNNDVSMSGMGFFYKNPIDTILKKIKFEKHMTIIFKKLCDYNNIIKTENINEDDKNKALEILTNSIKEFLEIIVNELIELTNKFGNKYELLNDNELIYYEKYLKYKTKYLELKKKL